MWIFPLGVATSIATLIVRAAHVHLTSASTRVGG